MGIEPQIGSSANFLPPKHKARRIVCGLFFVAAFGSGFSATGAERDDAGAWSALRDGAIVLLRHANAPGVGDPPTFRLGDCSTQRNLDQAGRTQSQRIGAAFAQEKIVVSKVMASQWCRTLETAELAFPGKVVAHAAFNSFFQDNTRAVQQTATARDLLLDWSGPGALVVVTHQVNITALSGLVPASGEGIVMRRAGPLLQAIGRIRP